MMEICFLLWQHGLNISLVNQLRTEGQTAWGGWAPASLPNAHNHNWPGSACQQSASDLLDGFCSSSSGSLVSCILRRALRPRPTTSPATDQVQPAAVSRCVCDKAAELMLNSLQMCWCNVETVTVTPVPISCCVCGLLLCVSVDVRGWTQHFTGQSVYFLFLQMSFTFLSFMSSLCIHDLGYFFLLILISNLLLLFWKVPVFVIF